MPTITNFYGISIRMLFLGNEHNPPHFHAYYNNAEATFDIKTLALIDGYLPRRAAKMVKEWAQVHQSELLRIWESKEFERLAPLE